MGCWLMGVWCGSPVLVLGEGLVSPWAMDSLGMDGASWGFLAAGGVGTWGYLAACLGSALRGSGGLVLGEVSMLAGFRLYLSSASPGL